MKKVRYKIMYTIRVQLSKTKKPANVHRKKTVRKYISNAGTGWIGSLSLVFFVHPCTCASAFSVHTEHRPGPWLTLESVLP